MTEPCLSVFDVDQCYKRALGAITPRQAWAFDVYSMIQARKSRMRKDLAGLFEMGMLTSKSYIENAAQINDLARHAVLLEQTALANAVSDDPATKPDSARPIEHVERLKAILAAYDPKASFDETYHHGPVIYMRARLEDGTYVILKWQDEHFTALFQSEVP